MRPMMIVLGLMFFNQFCGGNAFGFYAVMIFEHAGAGIDSHLSGVLVGTFQALATIIASLYVDKAGRRILLIISFVLMSLSLVTLGVFFYLKSTNAIFHEVINWIPLVSLVVFNGAYCGGVASLVWTVMSEVLPSNIMGNGRQFIFLYLQFLYSQIFIFGWQSFCQVLHLDWQQPSTGVWHSSSPAFSTTWMALLGHKIRSGCSQPSAQWESPSFTSSCQRQKESLWIRFNKSILKQ